MAVQETQPRFNLGYVVRETKIKADTLRAWERRYGLPAPERTDGGHRLYSQEDVDTVRWLMARQTEGLTISKAVKLWHSQAKGGEVPVREIKEESLREEHAAPYHAGQESSLDTLRRGWIEACLRFDNAAAQGLLSRAFASYPVKDVVYEVLQQGLVEIGELWYAKRASVQQEHFAASLALGRLHAFIADAPPPTRQGKVLVGGAMEEAHEFAPLLVNLLLRYQGWEVIYLGANVPQMQLEATLHDTRVRMVVLTAGQLHTAANLLDEAQHLQELGVQLGYGGAVFNRLPELRGRIPGHFLGEHIEDAVEVVETVLRRDLGPPVTPRSGEYKATLDCFREKQHLIEASLAGALPDEQLMAVTRFRLSQTIVAALRLGDMHYADGEIDWARGLIANHAYAPQAMRQFLRDYADAAAVHLDARGEVVLDWLNGVIGGE